MDAHILIIVPNVAQIEGLRRHDTYELDGVSHPMEPRTLHWQNVSLGFYYRTPYLERLLPEGYISENWDWLFVSDESHIKYYDWVNDEHIENEEAPVEILLRKLLENTDKWVVIYLLHDDQVDWIHKGDLDQCIAALRNTLRKDTNNEGFIIYN